MSYKHIFDHCLAEKIGSSGLASDNFEVLLESAEVCLNNLSNKSREEIEALFDLVKGCADLDEMEAIAESYCEVFKHVVILGIGGSSLGGQTLVALAPLSGNNATDQTNTRPCLHFIENIDPNSFERLFQKIEPEHTGFLVISKSGYTAETISQFIYCLDVFRHRIGKNKLKNHFTSITDPGNRPLREISEYHDIKVLDHHPSIGGRYSALSAPGMVPALIAGLDGIALRDGAANLINLATNAGNIKDVAPAVGAVIAVGLEKYNGINASVLMPYLDRLERFSKWYRQLWAESLGKKGKGITPINALGTTDQHSQLQLYLEGPKDKIFTLIFSEIRNKGGYLPKDLVNVPDLAYLADQRMGDLMAAEQQATFETLAKRGCPTRVLEIDNLDEYSMGALMMHFMLETILAGDLMGVNPFNQPAVDEGKILARNLMKKWSSK